MNEITFDTLAGGALRERFNDTLDDVLKNITDPNTEATKTRKMNITVSFKPNKNRSLSSVSFDVKATLQPAVSIQTEIVIDRDDDGNPVAAELMKGQMKGQIPVDEYLNESPKKVVPMK